MLQESEKPLQKGKYTLAKEFSRGYLQEIKTIREHYGQGNNFVKPASYIKSKTISFRKIGIDKFIDNKNEPKSKMVFHLSYFCIKNFYKLFVTCSHCNIIQQNNKKREKKNIK